MKKVFASLLAGIMLAVPATALASQTNNNEVELQNNVVIDNKLSEISDTSSVKVSSVTFNDGQAVVAYQANTIKLNLNKEDSKAKFKVVYNRNNWADWDVINDFSTDKEVEWTPKAPGKYEIYVDVDNGSGETATQIFSVNVVNTWTYKGVAVNSNIKYNQSNTIDANVGGTGNLKYKFVYAYNNQWSDWDVIQDWSDKSSASFTPKKLGDYTLYVDVKDEYGNQETKTVNVNSNYGWKFDGITAAAKSNLDDSLAINVKTSGENSNLKYKFVYAYNNQWVDWDVIEEGNEPNASFKAKKPGNYTIYVDVIDAKGNKITKTHNVVIDGAWTFTNATAGNSAVKVGETVKLTAITGGNTETLKYKFVYAYDGKWDDWDVISNYGSSKTADFIPKKAGKYVLYVDAMDALGKTITKTITITATHPWTYSAVAGVKNITIGESFTISPTIIGDKSDLLYKIVYTNADWSDWDVVKDWSDVSEHTFKPKKPGSYTIYYDVKDKFGNIITHTAKYNVAPDWTYVGLSVSSKNVKSGDTIKITPAVEGNKDGLTYKYVYSYFDWTEWDVIKADKTATSVDYKITKGIYYDIYVDITDRFGYTETKSVRITSDNGTVPINNKDWFSVVDAKLTKGNNYVVIDVRSGKRFNIKRWAGKNHADVEPLTVKDTAILKDIYGGKWSWERRPIVVLAGTTAYAASMNGMPHGEDTLPSNGFEGHICIHFLNSRTHGSNKVDPDHKKAVAEAAAKAVIKL